MRIPSFRLPNVLRVLGVLWLIAWPLYFTLGNHSYSSPDGDLTTGLVMLLIPAALVFAAAWWLDRAPTSAQDAEKGLRRPRHSAR